MNLDQDRAEPYKHPKNIVIGVGRIFWSDYTIDSNGKLHDEGWVLPGGLRTKDETEAKKLAVWINETRLSSARSL